VTLGLLHRLVVDIFEDGRTDLAQPPAGERSLIASLQVPMKNSWGNFVKSHL